MANLKPIVIVVMGVCGTGKTSVGEQLASTWVPKAIFADGDSYHPDANVAKMARGEPLSDDDRKPWLLALARAMSAWVLEGQHVVVACSALKLKYRDMLRVHERVVFVHLTGSYDLVLQRMTQRKGHFMKEGMLKSQLEALEATAGEKDVICVDVSPSVKEIVDHLCRTL